MYCGTDAITTMLLMNTTLLPRVDHLNVLPQVYIHASKDPIRVSLALLNQIFFPPSKDTRLTDLEMALKQR